MEKKRLQKINQGKKLFGVCTGLADYFNVDVTIIRLVFALSSLAGTAGIWAYIIAAIVLPEDETYVS